MICVSGATRVCGLFGDPVEHSLSPAMHNAAFEELGLNFIYLPFQVRADLLGQAVSAIRGLGLAGVNVTVPHKKAVVDYLDKVSTEAELIGAVNTILNQNGRLIGYNTDGAGFVRSLSVEAGFEITGKSLLILGAGGAARAVAVAAALSGAAEIIISNRTIAGARELSGLINRKTGCPSLVLEWYDQEDKHGYWEEILEKTDLVVQTTTMGMHPDRLGFPPFPYELLKSRHLAVDLVYNPAVTEFMRRCAASGADVRSGLGMLLYQGALAFEIWTGQPAPVEVMKKMISKGRI